MASAWNPATDYSPGDSVLYNKLTYYRGPFPPTPTNGTPPNVEMSVDTYGIDIRTWTLSTNQISFAPAFLTYYFRLIAPTMNTVTGDYNFEYSGITNERHNAYGAFESPEIGYSRNWDQFKVNPSPEPASPVCPFDKCGIALQQQQAPDIDIFASVGRLNPVQSPYSYHGWLQFNHPLYFRRIITVTTRILKTTFTIPPAPPVPDEWLFQDYDITPTDKNYTNTGVSIDYYNADNSVFTFTKPANTTLNGYTVGSPFIKDVSPND